jgi:hypothetical protein
MAIRPHPRQTTSDPHDGPWTTCDRCGWVTSQNRMAFQYDFFGGAVPQNTGFFVCERCTDDLAWQFKLLVLPPDPLPQLVIRPETYAADETNFLTMQDNSTIIDTQDGKDFVTSIPNPDSNESPTEEAEVDITTEDGTIIITEQGNPLDLEPNPPP